MTPVSKNMAEENSALKKIIRLTPSKISPIKTQLETRTIAKMPRTVKLLPNTPTQALGNKQGMMSASMQILPRKISKLEYDFSTIEQFSTAWRCSICQKISSTRKIAVEHLKLNHSKVDRNQTVR